MRPRHFSLILVLALLGCESPGRPALDAPSGGEVSAMRVMRLQDEGPYLRLVIPDCDGLNPASVPPITTFVWETLSDVADPDSVRWILLSTEPFDGDWNQTLTYIRSHPDAPQWSSWHSYDAASAIGTAWTSPPLAYGRYVFAVHGKRAGGIPSNSFELQRNAVRVLVSNRQTGAVVTLTSDFFEPIISATASTPPTIITVAPGTPLSFCWTTDASAYCGVVAAYRYGWDVLDLGDHSQWDVGFTPPDAPETCSPPKVFFAGTHTFHLEVMDNSGLLTRIPVRVNLSPLPVMHALDFRPGSCPNPLNPKSHGVISVALLGSGALDVSDVDLTSLALTAFPEASGFALAGQARIMDVTGLRGSTVDCDCPDKGPDGFPDLNLKFQTEEVVQAIGTEIDQEMIQLALIGHLNDGTAFIAVDCAQIVGTRFDEEPEEPSPSGPDTRIFGLTTTYRLGGRTVMETIDFLDAEPDTVPSGAWITASYYGVPDPVTASLCPDPINQCLSYQKNYTRLNADVPGSQATIAWTPSDPEDNNPYGATDSTSMNLGSLEYTVRFRAVDPFNRDLTPAEVKVFGNLSPALDDFGIESHDGTRVAQGGSVAWDWWHPANYHGLPADTLDLSDPPNIWVLKKFYFLVKATGHDHPKEADNGGIKSWFYQFRRSDDPSFVQHLGRSDVWHEAGTVNAVCDTVWLSVRYSLFDDPGGQQAWQNLPDWLNRSYQMTIEGRDTGMFDEFRQFIFAQGQKRLLNVYNMAILGRRTGEGTLTFYVGIER